MENAASIDCSFCRFLFAVSPGQSNEILRRLKETYPHAAIIGEFTEGKHITLA